MACCFPGQQNGHLDDLSEHTAVNSGNRSPKVRDTKAKWMLGATIALAVIAIVALVALAILIFSYALPVAVAGAVGTAVLAMGGTVKVATGLAITLIVSTIFAAIFSRCSKPTRPDPDPDAANNIFL